MGVKIMDVYDDKPGLNFASFTIESTEELDIKRIYSIGKYKIFVDKRAEGEGYLYNIRYMTNDSAVFIPKEDLIGNELI